MTPSTTTQTGVLPPSSNSVEETSSNAVEETSSSAAEEASSSPAFRCSLTILRLPTTTCRSPRRPRAP